MITLAPEALAGGVWTQFHDAYSGGDLKTSWRDIYIQAPIEEAKRIFEARLGRYPDDETCACCGSDYTTWEAPSLAQVTAYERGCAYEAGVWIERQDPARPRVLYVSVEEYVQRDDVLVFKASTENVPCMSSDIDTLNRVIQDVAQIFRKRFSVPADVGVGTFGVLAWDVFLMRELYYLDHETVRTPLWQCPLHVKIHAVRALPALKERLCEQQAKAILEARDAAREGETFLEALRKETA